MLHEPHVTTTQRRDAAVVRLTVPRDRIQEVMGPAIQEVVQVVQDQGIQPTGAIFSHHFRMDPEVFDFEVGMPVDRPVEPAGRVKPGELPAARAAHAVYQGPYDGLGEAWGELVRWSDAQGHEGTGEFWECYTHGPQSTQDPSAYRTDLYRALASDR